MWDCPEPEVWGEEWVTPELRRGMGGGQRKPCSVRSVPMGNVLGGQQPGSCVGWVGGQEEAF